MVNQSHSKWLRSTLQIHTGHLMNSPQCAELLGPIYAMLEARTRHYNSLLQVWPINCNFFAFFLSKKIIYILASMADQ